MFKLVKKDTILDKKTFKKHEEHALLLFVTGIVFGVGMSLYFLEAFWYSALTMLASLIIFYFIDKRE
ncbi:MAG: hypothetical protein J7K31_02740 [Candidatus Aenigmarchaeota archaeon]|nr:hypothetical protein [Candidatus Aenigmarchaeota archaeon]OYT57863.1 MAG: hypothetical protein B6U68_01255 [Candidatus Aenigmarchaeota archaeon ex4484_14]RLI96290.1 MAG: hypothetical protein DRO96_03455 [Candidatus Aenigmarchaeota archaeon]